MAETIPIENSKEVKAPEKAVRNIAELMQKGYSLDEAAEKTGVDKRVLRQRAVKEAIQQMLYEYSIPPAAARELVRAARIKVLVKNLKHDDDPNADKLVLDASKQIASDPDVGLNTPPAPLVTIDMGDLLPALKDLTPLEGLPEIEMIDVPEEDDEEEKDI